MHPELRPGTPRTASVGCRRARPPRAGIAIVVGLALPAVASAQPGAPPISSPATSSPAAETAPPDTPIAVEGRVIDALGQPVAGARVSAEGGDGAGAATTGRDGRFQLAARPGAELVIERDGYDAALARAAAGAIDDVVLLAAGASAETIEVTSEGPAEAPGAAKLDRGELEHLPGTGGDFVRALTAMPGVVNLQIPLGYNGVVIRGASPQDSKVLIDGFEVPLLFHAIAFRAVLPSEAIDALDYIPGGFDVSSGRASSGIIKLTTRPGSAERSEQGELSVIDGGVLAQGSLGAATRYLVGVRRSTIDLVLPSLIPADADLSLTTVPRYYDAQLRIDHDLSARWHVMLSALGSDDVLELVQSSDRDAAAKRLYNRSSFLRTTVAAGYHDGAWTASLALSGLLPRYDAEMGLYQFVRWTFPTLTPRAELAHTSARAAGMTDVVWQAGGEVQVQRVDLDLAVPLEQREGEPNPPMDPKDTSTRFDGRFWVPDGAMWTSLAANVLPRLRATAGVRGDVYGRSGEVVVQPRGELQLKLADPLTARLSAGMYSRPPEYQSELLTPGLRSERSTQTIAGLAYEPRAGVRIQTSGYYTARSHLITRNADGTLGNAGAGTTTGAELLASYRDGSWFGWLSYSYSHSTRIDQPGMASRLFDFDQPHSLNAAASWRRGRWQLGGRFQLYSGLPFTPVTGTVFESDRNLYVPMYGAVNSERAPIHHQLDLRVDYSWRWGAAAMTAFLDVQNVYMNESTVTYFYSYDYSQRAAFKSLPLLPSLGLRGVL
ncbi:MAG TPA: TonB-dependent receptor [Kofleriaceae bacterium]|nr:TonB-dependent receptor [Kofleriaceae bacterium]